MKTFKKKHTYLPRREVIERLIRRANIQDKLGLYRYWAGRPPVDIPCEIHNVCLARFDPNKRMNIQYYPDLRTFLNWAYPNRSLPIPKFFDMFRGMIADDVLNNCIEKLTNYRVEIVTKPEDWLRIYDDENIDSCMTGKDIVRCYAHPENKLALAALYPPGEDYVIARTIINTEDKWYVRLFGDPLLVEKLQEMGYNKMNKPPREFRMYAFCGEPEYHRDFLKFPYFDMFGHTQGRMRHQVFPDTFDPETGLLEAIINPGVQA